MKKIVILGAGGHASVIADIVRAEGNEVVAFLDDNPECSNCNGPISCCYDYPLCEFIIGIGNAKIREELSKLDLKWHTAIHPSSIISPSVEIGQGSVIMPNSVINANSIIGKHCIINSGSIIEHDNVIGDFSHISVGARTGGKVIIGRFVWVGIGSTIINNISICDDTLIGAGAVVVKTIESSGTYFGVPATKRR